MYYGNPYYIGGSDDLAFEHWGLDVYNASIYNPSNIMENGIVGQYHNSPYYASFIGKLIQFSQIFGGYTTFLPRIANAYFLVWICMIMRYLFLKYTEMSSKSINLSLALFAIMPHTQYINAHVFRDTFNLLQILLIVILFDFLLFTKKYSLKVLSLLVLPLLLYLTYYTRANSILFAGVIVIFMLSRRFAIKFRYVGFGIILILLLSNFLETFDISRYIEAYSKYVSNMADDGFSRFVFNRPLLPVGIVLRGLYALVSPFPDFFGLFKESSRLLLDLIQLLIYIGVLVQIFVIPFIIKRCFKLDWLSLSFLSIFIAIIASTFTFRHFIFYYPFMTAVAVEGYTNMQLNKR